MIEQEKRGNEEAIVLPKDLVSAEQWESFDADLASLRKVGQEAHRGDAVGEAIAVRLAAEAVVDRERNSQQKQDEPLMLGRAAYVLRQARLAEKYEDMGDWRKFMGFYSEQMRNLLLAGVETEVGEDGLSDLRRFEQVQWEQRRVEQAVGTAAVLNLIGEGAQLTTDQQKQLAERVSQLRSEGKYVMRLAADAALAGHQVKLDTNDISRVRKDITQSERGDRAVWLAADLALATARDIRRGADGAIQLEPGEGEKL